MTAKHSNQSTDTEAKGVGIIYMHGFASGPSSTKAKYFASKCEELGLEIVVPDLNQPSFRSMTLTRQVETIKSLIGEMSPQRSNPGSLHDKSQRPIILIGSSMGGLVATLAARFNPAIAALVLMAPGFGIEKRWTRLVGEDGRKKWIESGVIDVYHYASKKHEPLEYSFVKDLEQYATCDLKTTIPTIVFHGRHDDVVPFAGSENFQRSNIQVKLVELDDGHELIVPLDDIWTQTRSFLEKNCLLPV